jgi:hypothetical protein
MTQLQDWVAKTADDPVVWGKNDCTAYCVEWVKHAYGVDFGLPSYASRKQAQRLIASAGCLADLWGEQITKHGGCEVHEAQEGDVGVIDTSDSGQVGVIFTGRGAMIWKGDGGAIMLPGNPNAIVKVWSFR